MNEWYLEIEMPGPPAPLDLKSSSRRYQGGTVTATPAPEARVTVVPAGGDHHIVVELNSTSTGDVVVTGVAVRRALPTEPWPADMQGKRKYHERLREQGGDILFLEGFEPEALSVRDIRRMPLSSYVAAAVAAVTAENESEVAEVHKLMLPKGRPQRGKSTAFYKELAANYRDLAQKGKAPVPVIARKKKVDTNTVHQWIYRARQLGFLEKPPTRRRAK